MRLVDTHAHINFNAFKDDGDEVIKRSLEAGVGMIVVGSEARTSKRAIDYANRYDRGVWAAVGLHPTHLFVARVEGDDYNFVTSGEDFDNEIYGKLAAFSKVVAIGEIGLDYYHLEQFAATLDEIKEKQQRVLSQQLVLAVKRELPVLIHCREAHNDLLPLLRDFRREYRQLLPVNRPWGVLHCFSGNEGLAKEYFNLGLLVSFTGLITFCHDWDHLIKKLPADKFLVETDCPFMTPVPFRGQRNEPGLVSLAAERIAQLKNWTLERVAETTTANARSLFNIDW
jgi:TatD DNase family protein